MPFTTFLTGATGHMGQAVARELLARGARVRALVQPGDRLADTLPPGVERVPGDVTDAPSLDRFLDVPGEKRVIHCAGVITIAGRPDPRLERVNVGGTRNMLGAALRAQVSRFVYVGSVHAIPEDASGQPMREPDAFDPARVVGQYAKSKAAAAREVLAAAKSGLHATLALPSGLLGPYDYARGHMARMLEAVAGGRLRAVVRGGYDFADTRDVAGGLCACLERGRAGESYILAGGWHSVFEIARGYCAALKRKPVGTVLPLWAARMAAPFAEGAALISGAPALFTAYSLHTLKAPAHFSCEKAARELGYAARPLMETLRDMALWQSARPGASGK